MPKHTRKHNNKMNKKSRKHRKQKVRKITNPSGLSQLYTSVYGQGARAFKGGIVPTMGI